MAGLEQRAHGRWRKKALGPLDDSYDHASRESCMIIRTIDIGVAARSHVQRSRYLYVFVVESIRSKIIFRNCSLGMVQTLGTSCYPQTWIANPFNFEPIWRCTVSSLGILGRRHEETVMLSHGLIKVGMDCLDRFLMKQRPPWQMEIGQN